MFKWITNLFNKKSKEQEIEDLISHEELTDYTSMAIDLVYSSDNLTMSNKNKIVAQILNNRANRKFVDKQGYEYLKEHLNKWVFIYSLLTPLTIEL